VLARRYWGSSFDNEVPVTTLISILYIERTTLVGAVVCPALNSNVCNVAQVQPPDGIDKTE